MPKLNATSFLAGVALTMAILFAIGAAAIPNNSALPATFTVDITPSDSTDLSFAPRAIWADVAGTITYVSLPAPDGDGGTHAEIIPAGTMWPMRPARIKATGTTFTAGQLHGHW